MPKNLFLAKLNSWGQITMNKKYSGLLLAALMILPGCVPVSRYKAKSLKSIDITTGYQDSQKGVKLSVKRLTREDKKELFGDRSKKLYLSDEHIEVLYFSLHNLSGIDYSLSATSIDLAIMPSEKIVKLMKTSTIGRFMGTIGSLLGLGLVNVASWYGFSRLIKSKAPVSALIIPGFWFGGMQVATATAGKYASSTENSIHTNHKIEQDLDEKTSHDNVLIASGDAYEWLIFVKYSDYNPQFSLTLREKINRHNTIIFDVDLQASLIKTERSALPYYADLDNHDDE